MEKLNAYHAIRKRRLMYVKDNEVASEVVLSLLIKNFLCYKIAEFNVMMRTDELIVVRTITDWMSFSDESIDDVFSYIISHKNFPPNSMRAEVLLPALEIDYYTTGLLGDSGNCLLYTSPSPRDQRGSRMPSSA